MPDHAHAQPTAAAAPLSQHNPGSTRLGMARDERRREALAFLRDYYRDLELGRVPLD
jgi:hypothetical protein